MNARLLVVACGLLVLAANLGAQADSGQSSPMSVADSIALEAATTALASELRCPVCQGNSIQDSPSELALQMRALVRDQLRAGKSPDEVRAYFVDKYGEWILLAPKAEGFNLVVYIVPVLVILGGGLLVWRTLKRWTTTQPGSATR